MPLSADIPFQKRLEVIKKTLCGGFIFVVLASMLCPANEKDYFILGAEQGDGSLILPGQVQEGPDGNIYVMDRGDAYIKVYSPAGSYLRRIGGKGQGPGEIQRADGAGFGFTRNGKLYFTEYFGGHRWITLVELSGGLDRVLHLEIERVYGIDNAYSLADGGFLVELSYSSVPEMKQDYFLYRYPQSLLRVSSTGRVVSEIAKTDYFRTISGISNGADQWLPFIPAFAWAPYGNDLIIFSDGLSRNLKVYDYSGMMVDEIKTDLPKPEIVKDRDLDAWRKARREAQTDKAWFNRFGTVIYKYKKSVYGRHPILSDISSTADGNILVAGSSKSGEKTRFWLLGGHGKTLAETEIAAARLRISKHFIFFLAEDEEENRLAVCLKRVGKEREDLLRAHELQILK
jgi:hypothetical protein